jgi:putative hydrolase of HD superfamily
MSVTSFVEEDHSMQHSSPLEVVQAQLDAYNAKDIEALLATYSPKAEQYATGGKLLAQGYEQMRPRFLERFAEANLHARLLSRQVAGNMVADLELIERTFPEGAGSIEMLCVYEVVDGRILRATFATGEKKLFANLANAS